MIDPASVTAVMKVLEQHAERERSMAASFRTVGRVIMAKHHEARADAFDEAAIMIRQRWRESPKAEGEARQIIP